MWSCQFKFDKLLLIAFHNCSYEKVEDICVINVMYKNLSAVKPQLSGLFREEGAQVEQWWRSLGCLLSIGTVVLQLFEGPFLWFCVGQEVWIAAGSRLWRRDCCCFSSAFHPAPLSKDLCTSRLLSPVQVLSSGQPPPLLIGNVNICLFVSRLFYFYSSRKQIHSMHVSPPISPTTTTLGGEWSRESTSGPKLPNWLSCPRWDLNWHSSAF